MSDYREALQRLVNATQEIVTESSMQAHGRYMDAIDAAKALLARGEPEVDISKPLPCPFCGKQPSSQWNASGDDGYYGIDCCNAFAHAGDEESALKEWNRRVEPAAAEKAREPSYERLMEYIRLILAGETREGIYCGRSPSDLYREMLGESDMPSPPAATFTDEMVKEIDAEAEELLLRMVCGVPVPDDSPPAATGPCEKCGGAGRLTIYEKSRPWQDGYPIGDEPCPQCAPAATGETKHEICNTCGGDPVGTDGSVCDECEGRFGLNRPTEASQEQSKGCADIAAERSRQITQEGWTPEHDDEHTDGSLATAAACYAEPISDTADENGGIPIGWPWNPSWWKPSDRRRNLIKAGALIAAEIDRIDRLPCPPAATGE